MTGTRFRPYVPMSEPLPTDEAGEQSERDEIRTILAKRIRMIDAHLEEMELESPEDQQLAIKWTRALGSLSGLMPARRTPRGLSLTLVGEQEERVVGPDETERCPGVAEGVRPLLGDEQPLERLATGRTAEALAVFEVERLALLSEQLQPVAVLVDVEPAGDV